MLYRGTIAYDVNPDLKTRSDAGTSLHRYDKEFRRKYRKEWRLRDLEYWRTYHREYMRAYRKCKA